MYLSTRNSSIDDREQTQEEQGLCWTINEIQTEACTMGRTSNTGASSFVDRLIQSMTDQ
jgi:hypothetical protein